MQVSMRQIGARYWTISVSLHSQFHSQVPFSYNVTVKFLSFLPWIATAGRLFQRIPVIQSRISKIVRTSNKEKISTHPIRFSKREEKLLDIISLSHTLWNMEEFHRNSHINYFLSCLSGLPSWAISLDSSRVTVVYFSVIALDNLGALEKIENRSQICDYIYGLQLGVTKEGLNTLCKGCSREGVRGAGGFLGGSYLGQPFRRYNANEKSDELFSSSSSSCNRNSCDCISFEYMQGHLAMTYTALATLITLGDDLSRVDREAIINSLKYAYQESDGSFKATKTGTECDMRFVYCACAVSAMLGDWRGVDRKRVLSYVLDSITYEGGIALTPNQEAQGGATYCAVASLLLTGELSGLSEAQLRRLRTWCQQRALSPGGFNGRTNKVADSCYSFWIGASMHMLSSLDFIDTAPTDRSLLDENQSTSGGFGKYPEDSPDILHSFYSIAWLAINQTENCFLRPFHPPLGITQRAYEEHLKRI